MNIAKLTILQLYQSLRVSGPKAGAPAFLHLPSTRSILNISSPYALSPPWPQLSETLSPDNTIPEHVPRHFL